MQLIPEPRCVVVGVDGSPNSIAALHRAADAAQLRHARLDVVRALKPVQSTAPRLLRTATEWLRLRSLVARRIPRSQHIARALARHGVRQAPEIDDERRLLGIIARSDVRMAGATEGVVDAVEHLACDRDDSTPTSHPKA